jgi:hypothetical protein
MQTKIRKQYTDGFHLAEQDVRRLHQLVADCAAKKSLENRSSIKIFTRLSDGSILELRTVDELLSLDNAAEKLIDFLSISAQAELGPETEEDEPVEQWAIIVKFNRPTGAYANQYSIQTEVVGASRDWVVLTAATINDRVNLARRRNLHVLLSHPFVPVIVLLIFFGVGIVALVGNLAPADHHSQLEALYKAGKLANPVEALIALEKLKADRRSADSFLFGLFAILAAAALTSAIIPRLTRWLSEPYVFYWGDYITLYQKRRGLNNVLWSVVVLGAVVGVLSSYLSKLLGIQ